MNILFLTLSKIENLNDHDIYQDLMRQFIKNGHNVYVVTPAERRLGLPTSVIECDGGKILRAKVGNQSECSLIEKGISTLTIKRDYAKAIKREFADIHFDLILYATPPITLYPLVKQLKRKHQSITYLMLKDIFPQNAVDIGMMSSGGIVQRVFRSQEKQLYDVSDYIGCMSPANEKYLKAHNQLPESKIEICPNAVDPLPITLEERHRQKNLRDKYNIPKEACTFVYGGNLGKPQGIDFMVQCLKRFVGDSRVYILVIGDGADYGKVETFIEAEQPKNIRLVKRLPRNEYFELMRCADVGLVFLDHRFTIPNFPSRILPYMENYMPVACVTDEVSDVGIIAETNGFGWRCSSSDTDGFAEMVEKVLASDIEDMGIKAREYLEENYTAEACYQQIVSKVEGI